MSDFLRKAAGLIFNVEDSKEEPAGQKSSIPQKAVSQAAAHTGGHNTSPTVTPDNSSVEKFQAYFKALYNKANLPGPDFYEYHNMVEAMGDLITDDVKYPSVFAGFGGQLDKEKLVNSGQQYLDIIAADRADFDKTFQVAKLQKVAERQKLADKKAVEIKALQEKIAALNQEIVQLSQQASADELRLNNEQAAYLQQSDSFRQRITNSIERIKQYIK